MYSCLWATGLGVGRGEQIPHTPNTASSPQVLCQITVIFLVPYLLGKSEGGWERSGWRLSSVLLS
jgi:hypothetical protein